MSTSTESRSDKPGDYRLPTNVRPTHYDLTFRTDLEGLRFWGYGIIDLDILEDTDSITFNAAGIDLNEPSIVVALGASKHNHSTLSQNDKQERVLLKFSTTFKKGTRVQLSLSWTAALTDSMLGYYKSSFEVDGKKKHYALTQFEPTAARRAFPGWDEPLLKAVYSITLISRNGTVNLSNMPAVSEEPFGEHIPVGAKALIDLYPYEDASAAKSEWKVTVFEKTPPMSSYIVAFANGDFEYLEDSYTSPITGKVTPLRIYTTSDLIDQAKYALEIKRDCLPIYEKAFEVEFPLPKLDTLVAADFDAGAMENWGLITGRTTAFLYDAEKSSLSAKKEVALTQCHEVAHMWFGNITTMSWWDALWLNEGFATLMGEVIILNEICPDWKLHSAFISGFLDDALTLDSRRSSHPIQVDCPDANKINQIFDSLSYAKAASMLRMLSEYVGEKKFLKGVSIYLKNHLYGNSVPGDLWAGISESTGLDIAKMMDNWVWKIGYPVLTVKEQDGKLLVRQDRFLASGDATEEENHTIWYIPLNVLSTDASGKAHVNRETVLQERETTLEIDTKKPWKLNAGTSGVYRVAYEPERLKQLGEWATQADSPFSVEDRMGLAADAAVLAKAGFGKTSAALDLVESLHAEDENLVWGSIERAVHNIGALLWEHPEDVRRRYFAFQNFLFEPIVKKLGFEYSASDSTDITELRTRAITMCVVANEPSVVNQLRAWFTEYQKTGDLSIIPSDLQRATFRTAVEHGGKEEYESVKGIWKNPPSASTGNDALWALTKTTDLSIAKQTLELLTNGEVPLQDWGTVVSGLGTNRCTRRLLLKYFQDNYDGIIERYTGNFSLSHIIQRSHEFFTSEQDAAEIEAFFKGKDISKFNLSLAQALDAIRGNAVWLKRSEEDILSWLTSFAERRGL